MENIQCPFDLSTSKSKDKKAKKALLISLFLAVFFMLLEIIGGIFARSLALLSDALHMLTDVGTFILSLSIIKISHWPKTTKMSFGYKRAEVLGALGNILSLWALCALLIYESIYRLFHPQKVDGLLVLIIAAFGLCSNILMFWILHSSKKENLNVRAAFLHVVGDLIGTFGVLLSGLIILLTKIDRFDPLISLLFSFLMALTSYKTFKKCIRILMEGSPENISLKEVRETLNKIPGVLEIKDLHIWTVSSREVALSAHLLCEKEKQILSEAKKILKEKWRIVHSTIEIEIM